jgi:single-stranded-DNA-specific exonuclease
LPFARLLLGRGYADCETARRFLYPSRDDIHSYKLLKDIDPAITLVFESIASGRPILVYGDFDVDGIMSTMIMRTALEFSGAGARTYIPDRVSEGHGMRPEVVRQFAAAGVRTIVTVDQGTGSHEAIACAKQLGMTVIVTDHHLPQAALPVADAIINPSQPGCTYPNKAICGSGIAWQFARALFESRRVDQTRRDCYLGSLLKLVAIASIADVVPLVGENRALVRLGLEALREHQNPGLRMLFAKAGIREGWMPSSHAIAFRVSPRINAANRMAHANLVLDLFAAKDETTAAQIVNRLDELNSARRVAEQKAVEDISSVLEGRAAERAEVIVGWGWPVGINGIIASRLVERLGVPVFVLQADDSGVVRGSGRSVAGFNLMQALNAMHELFLHYGGHAQAAGVALRSVNVAGFRRGLRTLAKHSLSTNRSPRADGWLTLDELSPQLNRDLELLEPTGQGNPPAGFALSGTIRTLRDTTVLEQNSRTLELRGPEAVGMRQYAGSIIACLVDLLPRSRNCFLGVLRDWELEDDTKAKEWNLAVCDSTCGAHGGEPEPTG